MEESYISTIRRLGPSKKLGQSFLINPAIAQTEANFGIDKRVIEMGPGLGILTSALCKSAKEVLAVERDARLYEILSQRLRLKNLTLINGDFFDVPRSTLSGYDIMISNIPYVLSSKVLLWLCREGMPALLCLQKEFVEHMLAQPGSRDYSKLSVMASLSMDATLVLDVPAGNFYPPPRVRSALVFLRPKRVSIDRATAGIISAIMNHKKKKLRNAVHDSAAELGMGRDAADEMAAGMPEADRRLFQMGPKEILDVARHIKRGMGAGK